MNDNCAFRVYFNRIAHDKYTYDNYDRVATRSFDTDSKKEGFERIDTYHRDVYGRVVRQDNNFTGDELLINGYSTYRLDLYGREVVRRIFDSQDRLTQKQELKHDIYDRVIKRTSYTNEDTINLSHITTHDEYGRTVTIGADNNLNGKFDLGDTWRTHFYNNQGLVEKAIDRIKDGTDRVTIYHYDELNRIDSTFWDQNNNGKFDGDDVKHINTYHGQTNDQDTITRFFAKDETTPVKIEKFIYLNAGEAGQKLGMLHAWNGKDFTDLAYNVWGSVISSTEDYTTENWHRFFDKVGGHIQVINMSDARAKTEITLDNDVLRKITTGSELRIAGDSTDVVNLKNSHEFKKLDETKKVSNQEYNQYTTQVDGHDYTLLIDTDITTNLLP
ncbi:hypothetical protein [Mannheimia sp. ZY171111]|uniref:hypothetical protein n=1 Tax=Mannheimia sp. ZY171111 TaxID=2679995 RepID=UPI001ADDE4CF|nr:hypothetical protein [Mannheimia sp. ZY171111]QTM01249.1 hypothetical protein GM698_06440 [Mannheimia sp. ZY171111]